MRLRNFVKDLHIVLLMFLSVAFLQDISGQNFTVRNYTTRDGLPHNNVRAIARDSTGFLWIATWDGLSRFDGNEFKNYYHRVNDSTSLPFFSVYNLVVDRANTLWIITDNKQLTRYNRASDNFTTLKSIAGYRIEQVRNIYSDPDGNLWVFNKNEIIISYTETNSYKVLKLKSIDGSDYITTHDLSSAMMISDDELWLAGDSIQKFSKGPDGTFHYERQYKVIRSPSSVKIDFEYLQWDRIYVSPFGGKWIFSNKGLYYLDDQSGEFREFRSEIPPGEFTGSKHFIWGWEKDGIYIYNTSDESTSVIPGHLSKMPIRIIGGDDNTVWFSNTTGRGVALGLNHLIYTPGYFRNYLFSDQDSTESAVYSVAMDKYKRIWTGIRGSDHIVLTKSDGETELIGSLSTGMANRSGHIRSFIMSETGVWIGYFKDLLRHYDFSTGAFSDFFPDCFGYRAIAEDKKGRLLIGDENLSVFDPVSGKTEIIWHNEQASSFFKIYIDNDSILYASGSFSSLLTYNLHDSTSSIVSLSAGVSNAEDVIPGDNGDLWIALLGDGVCRYNPESGKQDYYTTSDGLSNNTTYNLLKDKSGNIWVSTNYGISRINPTTGRIRNFGLNEGLQISEFNSGAKFITENGEFIFGGMGGFVKFHPDSIGNVEKETTRMRILLTGLEVSGEPKFSDKPVYEADTIYFEKGENNFHLSFASTDFKNAEKTRYRYKLSDVNNNWIETRSNNRNINYANLRPGWYTLNIEASDLNGDWVARKEITLRIKPLFHQTWIFIILVPLIIITTIIFSVFTYIKQLKQREIQIKDELKLQSLRGQMNPHFIFNSLNSINYFISNNDRLSANRYIADFSRLIRSILANLVADYVPFESEISSIEDYLRIEHLRFGDKFDYEVATDNLIDKSQIRVSPGLVQPFIENAIWHGVRALENRKGFIRVTFEAIDNLRIRCIIEDDGVGYKASAERRNSSTGHRSKGIGIVEERLQITGKLNGTAYNLKISDLYDDRIETGTMVMVDIPLKRDQV